jgi:hypothetical protein
MSATMPSTVLLIATIASKLSPVKIKNAAKNRVDSDIVETPYANVTGILRAGLNVK